MKIIDFFSSKRRVENQAHLPKSREGGLERCVLCGELTDEYVSTDISLRKCYVEGAGQLCRKCCWETYGTTDLRGIT